MVARLAAVLLVALAAVLLVVAFAPVEPMSPPPRVPTPPQSTERGGSPPDASPPGERGPARIRRGGVEGVEPAPVTEPQVPETRRVRLRVVDEATGRGLHTMVLLRTARGVHTELTVPRPHGDLELPVEGVHRVWCGSPELEQAAAAGEIHPDDTEVLLEIAPEWTVAGRVVADDGGRVDGVRVHLLHAEHGWPSSTTSDDSGWFLFAPVPGAQVTLRAFESSGRSLLGSSAEVQAAAGDRDVVVRIRWRPALGIVVRDGSERPVGNLRLRATRVGPATPVPEDVDGHHTSVGKRTGSDGTVRFEDLVAGRYRVELAAGNRARRGYVLAEAVEVVVTGREDLVVRVRRGLAIEGTIVDLDGRPVADAEVEAHGGPGDSLLYALTGADGRFQLDGLDAGTTYELRATSQEGAATIVRDVAPGVSELRLELGDRRTLRGRFPKRFAGVRVRFEHEATGELVEARVNELGALDVLGLATGPHRVSVWVVDEHGGGRHVEVGRVEDHTARLSSLDLSPARD